MILLHTVFAFTSIPVLAKSFTMSGLPCFAAQCNAVCNNTSRENVKQKQLKKKRKKRQPDKKIR